MADYELKPREAYVLLRKLSYKADWTSPPKICDAVLYDEKKDRITKTRYLDTDFVDFKSVLKLLEKGLALVGIIGYPEWRRRSGPYGDVLFNAIVQLDMTGKRIGYFYEYEGDPYGRSNVSSFQGEKEVIPLKEDDDWKEVFPRVMLRHRERLDESRDLR